jgi:hypothetical protein
VDLAGFESSGAEAALKMSYVGHDFPESITVGRARPRPGTLHAAQDRNITAEDLFPFASTVDSGVAELVRKQEAGWAYVK